LSYFWRPGTVLINFEYFLDEYIFGIFGALDNMTAQIEPSPIFTNVAFKIVQDGNEILKENQRQHCNFDFQLNEDRRFAGGGSKVRPSWKSFFRKGGKPPGRKNQMDTSSQNVEGVSEKSGAIQRKSNFLWRLVASCFVSERTKTIRKDKKLHSPFYDPNTAIDRSAPLDTTPTSVNVIYAQTPEREASQLEYLLKECLAIPASFKPTASVDDLLLSTTFEESFYSRRADEDTEDAAVSDDAISDYITNYHPSTSIEELAGERETVLPNHVLICHEIYTRTSFQYKTSVLEGTAALDGQKGVWMPPKVPLLPPTQSHPKKCLIVDLDETLIHSFFHTIVPEADWLLHLNLGNPAGAEHVSVCKRPGAEKFLQAMSQYYEIVIFTASLAPVHPFFIATFPSTLLIFPVVCQSSD
jgi:NLI interacting factor-like phosphatase